MKRNLFIWTPLLALLIAVVASVSWKYISGPAIANSTPGSLENCEVICERVIECALENFGDTAANRDSIPAFRSSCSAGCVKHETKIRACFREDLLCPQLAECAVELFYGG